jgi:NAD-dependent dihydropyrimidine dehydrogenase PreA subunit/flavodoxin
MKGAIVYYSLTGNTLLACKHIQSKLSCIKLDLYNMLKCDIETLMDYDVIGFAFFTDAWQPPKIFTEYIEHIKSPANKYTFIFNTYGCISGKSILTSYRQLHKKGMKIIATHSLHTPENYPPMIAAGKGYEQYPMDTDMKAFQSFIQKLDDSFRTLENGGQIPEAKLQIGLLNRILPSSPNVFTRIMFGSAEMKVDSGKCIKCGICQKNCPAQCITINEQVSMNNSKCQKCWSCYNHCPKGAITYGKFKGQGQYPKPSELYANKMQTTESLHKK